MDVKVIPIRVKPKTVEKLQAEVTVLEKDVLDKQKMIDKLWSDLAVQQQISTDLEGRIEDLEGMITP